MAQHHLAGAWNEIRQGATQQWGQLSEGCFEDLERHRDLLVSLSQISRSVAREGADRQFGQWRARTECEVLVQPPPRAHWRLWRIAKSALRNLSSRAMCSPAGRRSGPAASLVIPTRVAL